MSHREFESTIHTEFPDRLDYGSYLALDEILAAQHPVSVPEHHDEMLFIIQHQTSELWMKLVIHELRAAITYVQRDDLSPSFKILARVKATQRMLFEQWAVLETLTPSEYVQFRHFLGRASGFQSHQFRTIEFLMGNKDRNATRVFEHRSDVFASLVATLEKPSLYDEFLLHLSRAGLLLATEVTNRDWSLPYQPHESVREAFLQIYQQPQRYWDAYEMCEKLVDVEEQFSLWRYRHMLTVERIIGYKTGTGGSSGVSFLRKAIDIRLFPELWQVRTDIK